MFERPAASLNSEQQELQNLLEMFDIDELQNLIQKYANPEDAKKIELISRKAINTRANLDYLGVYHAGDRSIELNFQELKKYAQFLGVRPEIMEHHVLIHEQTHAASDATYECSEGDLTVIKDILGFREGQLYKAFNEGCTEKFARQLFAEHAVVTGVASSEDVLQYLKSLERDNVAIKMYTINVQLVNAVICQIAKEVSIDEKDVWAAMIRDFLHGQRWSEREFVELAQDVFPPNFLEDLSRAQGYATTNRLIKELTGGKHPLLGTSSFVRRLKRSIESTREAISYASP